MAKTTHTIYAGTNCDNLEVMRSLPENSVDLIYLDPPFNSKRLYDAPIGSKAEGVVFSNKWTMTDVKEEWLQEIHKECLAAHAYILAVNKTQGQLQKKQNNLAAYLIFMAIRLIEMKYLLKETGSIYLHCDPTVSHYLKGLMDCIFGVKNFRNDIVWCYTSPSNTKRYFPRKTDNILYYVKNEKRNYTFNGKDIRTPYKKLDTGKTSGIFKERRTLDKKGKIPENWWSNITPVARIKKERLYINGKFVKTQKPLALLERIIKASSNKGNLILDPFCGSTTTNVVAATLNRNSIGIDVSEKAGELLKERLEKYMKEKNFLRKNAPFEKPIIHNRPPKTHGRPRKKIRQDLASYKKEEIKPSQKQEITDELYLLADGICPACNRKRDRDIAELDHILPLSKKGSNTRDNVQYLCRTCNSRKGGRRISNEELLEEYKNRKSKKSTR